MNSMLPGLPRATLLEQRVGWNCFSGSLPQYQISVRSSVFLTLLSTVNSVSTI